MKTNLTVRLRGVDFLIANRPVSDDLVKERRDVLKKLSDIEVVEGLEYSQNAKIKWATEGDENTKFFHGMLKKGKNICQNKMGY